MPEDDEDVLTRVENMNHGSSSKSHKYRASKTIIDGYTFPSMKEAGDYIEAKRRQERGEISDLRIHPFWELCVNGVRIGRYTADLSYFEEPSHEFIVQDSKGFKTLDYGLRKKLMKAIYGIDIREV